MVVTRIHIRCRFSQPRFAASLFAGLLVAACWVAPSGVLRSDEAKPRIWQKLMTPRAELPRFLTKPAKPTPEMTPREAAQACLTTAKELFDSGYDREAIQLFERARQLDPKQTQVARYLAVLYDRQLDGHHAQAEYDKALKLTPKDPDLLNDVGYFHYQYGRWAEAEASFRAALRSKPTLERAKINLGMTLCQADRYGEAFDVFREVVGPAAAHSNIGLMLAGAGRRDEALRALHQALVIQPSLPQARAMLEYLEQHPDGPRQLVQSER